MKDMYVTYFGSIKVRLCVVITVVLFLLIYLLMTKVIASNPPVGSGIDIEPTNGYFADYNGQLEYWVKPPMTDPEFEVTVVGLHTTFMPTVSAGFSVSSTSLGGGVYLVSVTPSGSSAPVTLTLEVDGEPCWVRTFVIGQLDIFEDCYIVP